MTKGRAKFYTQAELDWVKAHSQWPRKKLHAWFCKRFWRDDVSVDALKQLCLRNGWKTGRTGTFVKGSIPANKGKKGVSTPGMRRTQFKPGQIPPNARGAGHERVETKQGYIVMIVAQTNPWTGAATRPVFKHRWLWEQENGPIPEGHVLKCWDGDKTNCEPENWFPVSRSLLPRLNGQWSDVKFDDAPPELKATILAKAKLAQAAADARKRAADHPPIQNNFSQ